MKKKIKIYEFDTTIYPRILYVVKSVDKEAIKAEFTKVSGEELNLEGLELSLAYTIPVMHRKNTNIGHLVVLQGKKEHITTNVIAHEADHVANQIFQDLNMTTTFTEDEHHAYLVGWIAEKIASVVWGK